MAVDYRKILKSYMRYVARSEGITFVRGMLEQARDEALTDPEREALEMIHCEVRALEKDHLG